MLCRLCISQLMISLMYVFSRITGVSAHIPFLYLRVVGVCVCGTVNTVGHQSDFNKIAALPGIGAVGVNLNFSPLTTPSRNNSLYSD